MIRKNTLNSVISLATVLSNRGYTLSAAQGTPIASLITAGELPAPDRGNLTIEWDERILRGSMTPDQSGVVKHDLVMDEIREVVAKTIRRNLDVARNQAIPLIAEVIKKTQEYVDNAERIDPTAIQIIPDAYSKLWDSHYLVDQISRFEETPARDLKLSNVIPMPMVGSPMELVKTDVTRFDQDIEEFLKSKPGDFVTNVWNRLFVGTPDTPGSLNSLTNPLYSNPDEVLIMHLLACRLLDNIPDGVRMGMAEYKVYIGEIIAQTGRSALRITQRRESDNKNKVLVKDWGYASVEDIGVTPITIKVNADLYGRWLDAGGAPEVLMGAFVVDKNKGYDVLLDRAEKYREAWERQERILSTNARMNRTKNYQTGLALTMTDVIKEIPDEQLVAERTVYLKNFNEYFRSMPNDWFDGDVYRHIRQMICTVIYGHTDVYETLVAIDSACKANPDVPVRNAAFAALPEIVGTWLARLLTVNKTSVAPR